MTKAEVERMLRAVPRLPHDDGDHVLPDYPALAETVWTLWEKDVAYHRGKWQEYERDYILPLFGYAEEDGWSLQTLVAEARGNCVVRYVGHARAERDALRAEVDRLTAGITAVQALINESHGVSGFHLNGEMVPWDYLLAGGRYDAWLRDFSAALTPPQEP